MPANRPPPLPSLRGSLLDTRALKPDDILSLFAQADVLDSLHSQFGGFYHPAETMRRSAKVVCCLFFEASTRTRMSFQMAACRLGYRVLTMDPGPQSSVAKGETDVDTVLNIAAMGPDALVIRYANSPGLDELLPRMTIPVINAGSGTTAHPTQGLLDAYTIRRDRALPNGRLDGQRVLMVGDVSHSRVVRSTMDVLAKLGAEIGLCGPKGFLPSEAERPAATRVFENLDEGVEWATVYIGLRIQLERHGAGAGVPADYHAHFGLNQARLKKLRPDAMIMHPGPINHGVEFCDEVMTDPRTVVLKQVTNGVLIRAALLSNAMGEWTFS